MRESYSLRFRFESRRPGAPEGSRKWAYTAAIWRSGDKLRVDVYDRESDGAADEQSRRGRHVTCRNCERENYTLVTTVLPAPPGTTHIVEFRDSRSQLSEYFVPDIDWRFLGLCNAPLATYNKIPITQSYRERMANPLLRTSEQDRNGGRCLVAEIKRDKGLSSIWFGLKEKYNPVWHKSESESGGTASLLTTEARWHETAGKHLYPERITHTSLRDGALYYQEIITVQHADFDSPVEPSVFTLAGLGLNENQPIAYPNTDAGAWPVWRDGRADPSLSRRAVAQAAQAEGNGPVDPGAQNPPPVAAYPVSGNTSLVVGLAFGALAVVALALAVRHRRKRS